MCTVLRQEGVNAYSLSLLTNERPLTEKDPRSALLLLRLVRRKEDPRSAHCATKDLTNRKEAIDRWLRHFHPARGGDAGELAAVCLNPYNVKVILLALFHMDLARIMQNAKALKVNAAAHQVICAAYRQRCLAVRALPTIPKKLCMKVRPTPAAERARDVRLRELHTENERLRQRTLAMFRGHKKDQAPVDAAATKDGRGECFYYA